MTRWAFVAYTFIFESSFRQHLEITDSWVQVRFRRPTLKIQLRPVQKEARSICGRNNWKSMRALVTIVIEDFENAGKQTGGEMRLREPLESFRVI
jgi:hypothetical protein